MTDTTALLGRLVVDNDSRARVVALRGLPASGKSTAARAAVAAAATPGSVVRINNDDLATMLYGTSQFVRTPEGAETFAALRAANLKALLSLPHIQLIIIDNTNLAERSLRDLEKIVIAAGARFEVDDTFLAVPVEVCIERDAQRAATVGETVIRRMQNQARNLRPWVYLTNPLADVTPYDNDPALPNAVIVDIDGTLATMQDRGPFEWHRVGEDAPNRAVVDLVRDLIAAGENVIIMSGRDGVCRPQTEAWLAEHVAPGLPLHMRAAGDQRADSIVKWELFRDHVAGKYHVRFVLDDRDQVIHLWRRVLDLPTFQVADGNF